MRVSFQCFLPRTEASFEPGMRGGLGRERIPLLVLVYRKKAKLLSLVHRVFLIWLHPAFPVHPLSFQLLVRNRPFQWLYAPVQAVFSAWNAFLWPPYLAWSRWYFTPFCFPLERDWPSFGPQLRQVYLWHTLWVIFLPLASCVFFFLCLFLTLIFNSLQFSLLLVFHVQHYIWKALLCLFGYITGDKEICLWLPA